MLKTILSTDKSKFQDYENVFEENAFKIAYKLTLFLSISTLSLSILIFFTNSYIINFIFTFIGFVIAISAFLVIHFTRKHRLIMLIFNIIGCLLIAFALFYTINRPRIIEGLWMMINASLAFVTLGKKWGFIITTINSIVYATFFLLYYNEQVLILKEISKNQILSYVLNIVIAFSFQLLINWQSMNARKKAQEQIDGNRIFLEKQFELINKQNDEKTLLLKEIHHRVKNNLQVIVSLLRLQSQYIDDPKINEIFKEAVNRIITMSLIHEKIYKSETLSSVDIEDYFKSLAEQLLINYSIKQKVNLKFKTIVKQLDLKPIVPLALIFNELVSNSIKYAFNENNLNPEIRFEFKQINENKYELKYSDNGKWKKVENKNGFGLKLINTLCEQLEGNYNVEKLNEGTFYNFYFEKFNS